MCNTRVAGAGVGRAGMGCEQRQADGSEARAVEAGGTRPGGLDVPSPAAGLLREVTVDVDHQVGGVGYIHADRARKAARARRDDGRIGDDLALQIVEG